MKKLNNWQNYTSNYHSSGRTFHKNEKSFEFLIWCENSKDDDWCTYLLRQRQLNYGGGKTVRILQPHITFWWVEKWVK